MTIAFYVPGASSKSQNCVINWYTVSMICSRLMNSRFRKNISRPEVAASDQQFLCLGIFKLANGRTGDAE
jgi:hypothetical protein